MYIAFDSNNTNVLERDNTHVCITTQERRWESFIRGRHSKTITNNFEFWKKWNEFLFRRRYHGLDTIFVEVNSWAKSKNFNAS